MARKTTINAAYRKAIDEGKSRSAAVEYAKEINERVNYDYGVADTPDFMRRTGPLGQLMFQFKKYPIKTMELAAGMNGKERAKWFAGMFLMSGMMGMPLFNWIKDMIKHLWDEDIEMEIKKAVADSPLPNAAKRTLLYGVMANAGVDIGRRVGLGDILPSDMSDLPGPAASTIVRVLQTMPRIFNDGNFLDTIEAISPGVSNPIKTLMIGESKDKRNRTKFRYETAGEKALAAVGFRPIRQSVESDATRIANHEETKRSAEEARAINNFIEVRESGYKPSSPEWKKAQAELKRLRIKGTPVAQEIKKRKQYNISAYDRKFNEGKKNNPKANEKREIMRLMREMN
ncbi:hypothetical protein FACS1894167_12790 [Synergistales bacterium]|nr:hypothetical protein FACS1894167_12790 [Synergistales bacterium]